MRKTITFLLIILFQLTSGLTYMYIKTNGVEFKYLITTNGQCLIGNDRFRVFQGFSITDCVVECGLRPHCMALNYIDQIDVCELLSSDNGRYANNGKCRHVKRSHIRVIKIPCTSCMNGQACDRNSKRCKHKECINFPVIQNGKTLGNRKEVGMILRYTCYHGFKDIKGVNGAKCLDTGNWDQIAECVRDCREPSAISDAIILDGGTTEGSTRTVKCNIDGSSATITCLNNGAWSPLFPCPVCKTNWVYFSGSCYLFSTETLNWEAAKVTKYQLLYDDDVNIRVFGSDYGDIYRGSEKNDCGSKGSVLVSVKDNTTHQFISGKLQDMNEGAFFWIGGRYDVTAQSFLWLDGSSLPTSDWVPNALNNVLGRCMMYTYGTTSGRWEWIGFDCSNGLFPFICESGIG